MIFLDKYMKEIKKGDFLKYTHRESQEIVLGNVEEFKKTLIFVPNEKTDVLFSLSDFADEKNRLSDFEIIIEKYIIESFHENSVKLEDFNDPTHYLGVDIKGIPENAKEGDILGVNCNKQFIVLEDETQKRKEEIEKKFQRILNKK